MSNSATWMKMIQGLVLESRNHVPGNAIQLDNETIGHVFPRSAGYIVRND